MIRYYPDNIRKFIADQPDGRSVPPSEAFGFAAPEERRWTDIRPS